MFKKNKKRKIILIILLLVLVISGFLFYFLNIKSSSKKTTATSITYNASDYNDDFSDCEEVVVNLDDVDSKYTITKRGVYRLTGSLNGYIEVNTSSNVKIIFLFLFFLNTDYNTSSIFCLCILIFKLPFLTLNSSIKSFSFTLLFITTSYLSS